MSLPHADPSQHDHFDVDEESPIDWHRHTFPLGVRTEMTQIDPPFLALSKEELRVLEAVLTTKFPGADFSASEEYIHLLTLATWAKRAREWAERREQ